MNKRIDFEYLLNISPEKAVEYLENKGYKISRNWLDIYNDSSNKAFSVAGVMKEDILKDIKNTIIKAIKSGMGYETFKKHIKEIMQVKGWYISPWRLKFIYQQNLDIAYSVGRFEEQWSVRHLVPYWQYVTMNDERVRDSHKVLHNLVFKSTDPIWKVIYPPSDFGCRCFVKTYNKKEAKRLGLKLESSYGKIGEKDVIVGSGDNKQTIKVKTFEGKIISKGFKNPIGELFKK